MLTSATHHVYEFGPFRLEEAEFLLLREGKPVPLKGKTFQLLLTLVRNAGRVVMKEDLMAQVWPQAFVEDHNLTVHISDLRKALGHEHQYVETVARHGYRFVANVTKFEQGDDIRTSAETSWTRPRAGRLSESLTIAVLPLKPITGDIENEYLGLGMADALITRLSSLKQVIVRPTSAVRRYVEGTDPVLAGRELRVRFVLDGSIQRFGMRIRVTVQLISISEGTTMWAAKYDGSCDDILDLEDLVSEQVAASLALELTLEESQLLVRHQTESIEAHTAYMKGRFFWDKRSLADINKSIEYFTAAIDIDPNYAIAYVGLARAKVSLFALNFLSTNEELSEIEQIVDKALRLDANLSEAHSIKAETRLYINLDWAGAEEELKAAISVGQRCAIVFERYSTFLALLGRFEEALALNDTAQRLEPASMFIVRSRCRVLFFAGEYERSISELKTILELTPNPSAYFLTALNYDQLGEHKKAQATYNKYYELYGNNPEVLSSWSYSLGISGDSSKARRILAKVLALSRHKRISSCYIAIGYLGLGEVEKSLSWLEKALSETDSELILLRVDPRFGKLRTEVRFLRLLESVIHDRSGVCSINGEINNKLTRRWLL